MGETIFTGFKLDCSQEEFKTKVLDLLPISTEAIHDYSISIGICFNDTVHYRKVCALYMTNIKDDIIKLSSKLYSLSGSLLYVEDDPSDQFTKTDPKYPEYRESIVDSLWNNFEYHKGEYLRGLKNAK